MEAPIRYAKSGNVHIAYRVFGDGARDIVLIPGTLSHVEVTWERPHHQHLLKRLLAFARVIVFDKRGQGLSDRVVSEQTLEERIGDVSAVMDAAGSERATVYGWSEGGPMCLMFCATYPERVSSLVLQGTFASARSAPSVGHGSRSGIPSGVAVDGASIEPAVPRQANAAHEWDGTRSCESAAWLPPAGTGARNCPVWKEGGRKRGHGIGSDEGDHEPRPFWARFRLRNLSQAT